MHEREVSTNYAGELLQHDSSFHKWSPYSDKKWYLITTLDDYSRYILYAGIFERETTWRHIAAFKEVSLTFGLPFAYYVDNHSIFRFVRDRDPMWVEQEKGTDDVDPQWKKVLRECNVNVNYALSPQAKGKIERPYRWLQDRIVRICARDNVSVIDDVRDILDSEIKRYNEKAVHSITREIPAIRMEKALRNGKSLFRPFDKPVNDIFSLRFTRRTNAYRKIQFEGIEFNIPGVDPREEIEIRTVPDEATGLLNIQFWHDNRIVSARIIKLSDIKKSYF